MSEGKFWEFPGGKIEHNETIEEAIVQCKLISGTPTASEHTKSIWLGKYYLTTLIWVPADIPTIEKLSLINADLISTI